MAKKKSSQYIPPAYLKSELVIGGKKFNDVYTQVYASLLFSPAFQSLTPRQRMLLIAMHVELFLQSNKPFAEWARIHPQIKPDYSGLRPDDIYFPADRAAQYYSGYKNHKRFTEDRRALEERGFIKTVSNGKKARQKSIYRYSTEWKLWKPPENEKPAAEPP